MTLPALEDKGTPLGRKLASLRVLRGWSQGYVANQLEVAPATLSRYENGRLRPNVEVLGRMARLYGTTIDYIVNHEPPAPLYGAPATQTAA